MEAKVQQIRAGGLVREARGAAPRSARAAIAVVVASLLLGGLTSWAQYLLPFSINPLANSISGWTMATAILVWFARGDVLRSAAFGVLSFVALTIGYAIVSAARGFHDDPTMWALIGVAAGPFVGAAAGALRGRDDTLAAAGSGLLAGVLAGDAFRGFTVLVATTGWFYWSVVAMIAVLFAVAVAVRLLRTARLIALQVGVGLVVAAALNVGISVL